MITLKEFLVKGDVTLVFTIKAMNEPEAEESAREFVHHYVSKINEDSENPRFDVGGFISITELPERQA